MNYPTLPNCPKNWQRKEQQDTMSRAKIIPVLVTVICLLFLFFWFVSKAHAQFSPAPAIDLSIIAQIESSNNPLAYNRYSQAKGIYQITPICLEEYNQWHKQSKIASNALFSPVVARTVAEWYLATRIPQMLKYYHKPVTLENCLFAYNAGIGKVVKGIMPNETKQYIIKYNKLVKARGK